MSPFDNLFLSRLCALARHLGGPVRTVLIADLLGIADRTARKYARRLEQAGLVMRLSPKGGWLPV